MQCSYFQSTSFEDQGICGCPEAEVSGHLVHTSVCDNCLHRTIKLRGAGDLVERGLSAIGITKERVNKVVKAVGVRDCGCSKRQALLNQLIPFTGRVKSKYSWAVAVTTAPRYQPTLPVCLNSLRSAGWNPIVFAEPDSIDNPDPGLQIIQNSRQLGVWHNWLNSAKWCLNNTDAELIMTVQDDVIIHQDSLEFAESILWPSERCGFLSLYTPKHYQLKQGDPDRWSIGVRRVRTKSLWGACVLVWPRKVLEKVVSHKIAEQWLGAPPRRNEEESAENFSQRKEALLKKRAENPSMIANSDTAIGKIVNHLGLEMWFVDPSPAQHIARHSTVSHGDNSGRRNCHRCADFNLPLKSQVLDIQELS